jgi:hypothetical protein
VKQGRCGRGDGAHSLRAGGDPLEGPQQKKSVAAFGRRVQRGDQLVEAAVVHVQPTVEVVLVVHENLGAAPV